MLFNFIHLHIFNICDVVGSVFSFLATIYSIRDKSATWTASLVAICIEAVVYFNKGLYGDTGLHIIYFLLAFYGWFQWKYGGKKRTTLPISQLTAKLTYLLLATLFFGIVAGTAFLKFCTDSQVPLWDSSTTVISLVADFLMSRKIIQCWHLWFVADGLFAGMYFYKGIPAHGVLYAFYVSLAVVGYLKWKRQGNMVGNF